jgi:hypothetical protein
MEVNTGPWVLDLLSADAGKEAMERYNRPPEQKQTSGP